MSVGTLLRRHRVTKPPPMDSMFYTVEDLNVGNELNIYARVYKLIDADQFTKNFLTKLGVRLGEGQKLPEDPYTNTRKAVCFIYFLFKTKFFMS